jgi:hypothetical protein
MKEGSPLELPGHQPPETLPHPDDDAGLVRIGEAVRDECRRLAKIAPVAVAAELRTIADRSEGAT